MKDGDSSKTSTRKGVDSHTPPFYPTTRPDDMMIFAPRKLILLPLLLYLAKQFAKTFVDDD